jgi:F-type H+-transporting ATPase subunit epsilon
LGSTFSFELLTPEAVLLRDTVLEVIAPGWDGYFGVLAGHEYFATALTKGTLTVRRSDQTRTFAVDGGIIQVTPDKVVVCAEQASESTMNPSSPSPL